MLCTPGNSLQPGLNKNTLNYRQHEPLEHQTTPSEPHGRQQRASYGTNESTALEGTTAKLHGVKRCSQPARALTSPTSSSSKGAAMTATHYTKSLQRQMQSRCSAARPAVEVLSPRPNCTACSSASRCSQEPREAGEAAKPCCSVTPHNQCFLWEDAQSTG